jgi:HSP20 family protein
MTTTLARVFAPFETGFGGLFPFVPPEIRIEQTVEEGQFVVRAEIPGVDPDKDVEVTVDDGVLRIRAERTEQKRERTHSEFHYGRLVRAVALPPGAQEDGAKAVYAKGILEISFALGEAKESAHRIPIDVVKEVETKAKR